MGSRIHFMPPKSQNSVRFASTKIVWMLRSAKHGGNRPMAEAAARPALRRAKPLQRHGRTRNYFCGFPLEKFRPILSVRFAFMDASSSVSHAAHDPHRHDAAGDHHELPFWRKYIISTDHKV